jgi:hypothetical protein
MKPTSHLRFVERAVVSMGDVQQVRILQQWWSGNLDVYIPSSPDGRSGEWRDVPLEETK